MDYSTEIVHISGEKLGVILMFNSDNAENIYIELLQLTIGDVYTPYKWLRYTSTKNKQ